MIVMWEGNKNLRYFNYDKYFEIQEARIIYHKILISNYVGTNKKRNN